MEKSQVRTGEKFRDIKNPQEIIDGDWDSSLWVGCEFEECQLDGADIMSTIFSRCHFQDVSLYWCMGFQASFLECKFVRCDLRGSFDEAKFVRCGFVECEVGDDSLGGSTIWENAQAIECVVSGEALPISETSDW